MKQSHVIALIAIAVIAKRQQVQHMHQLLFHQSELKVSGELKYFETLGSSGRAIKERSARRVVLSFLAYLKLRLK